MTFNSHRMQYDFPYATNIDGYGGLVVCGPMQATWLHHFASDLPGHARRIQKECSDARESVQSNQANPVGTVYLGVPSAYSVALLPP